jgi:6-pyruvoyltetrahydropterin/6-carboxytetrahydropterin synthase
MPSVWNEFRRDPTIMVRPNRPLPLSTVAMERYHVRVSKDYLVFSAAHFITFSGGDCERLHGHNYRVAAEVEGPLDENQYVVDFIALRNTLRAILDDLDHRMLLPTGHPQIHVAANAVEVEVTFADRRWVFPRGDCVLLPIANTTAELLARHIGLRLLEQLHPHLGDRHVCVRIEVDESFGQSAICELDGGPGRQSDGLRGVLKPPF